MPFCSGCGAVLEKDAACCSSCGWPVGLAADYAPARPAPHSALRAALAMFAVVLVLIVAGIGALLYTGYRAWRAVRAQSPNVSVGVAASDQAFRDAREMGLELYPGARPVPNLDRVSPGVTSARFVTGDPRGKVFSFYLTRYPRSEFLAQENCSILTVVNERGTMVLRLDDREAPGRGTFITMSNIPQAAPVNSGTPKP